MIYLLNLQCQATVVGFLASIAAMVMGWVPEGKFDVAHGLLLCASSLVTASLASFVLGMSDYCMCLLYYCQLKMLFKFIHSQE